MSDEPHLLYVPEHFRVWLYSVDGVHVQGKYQSAFCLLAEEVRRGGPNGYVDMSTTWRFPKYRLKQIAEFLTFMTTGVPRGEEAERVVATAKKLAAHIHDYIGTSAIDRLGELSG